MTATARVAATTTADTTYTGSVSAGSSRTFYAYGLKGSERVNFEAPDSGGDYFVIRTLDGAGNAGREAYLGSGRNQITLNGPIDFRINKPVTANPVEVGEYT